MQLDPDRDAACCDVLLHDTQEIGCGARFKTLCFELRGQLPQFPSGLMLLGLPGALPQSSGTVSFARLEMIGTFSGVGSKVGIVPS